MAAQPDTLILGAGIIGLSLALELQTRGHAVEIFDPSRPLTQASAAAAGMLAVDDPHNPTALLPLSRLSGSLYAAFLANVKEHSGLTVPFQTEITRQVTPGGSVLRLAEHSLDPRQLAPALLAAVEAAGVRITRLYEVEAEQSSLLAPDLASTLARAFPHAANIVYTTGAWAVGGLPLAPRKGQMMRVQLPPGLRLTEVYRNQEVYVVPRTLGPQAGTALIGAPVEDAGFDLSIVPADLAALRQLGATLVAELASPEEAPMVEAWAGLRPATPDGLPMLGPWNPQGDRSPHLRHFVAGGHFRNGILLAPATAVVMADLLEHRVPDIDLAPFAPSRFAGLR